MKQYKVPIVLCRKCKKWMPVNIRNYRHKKYKKLNVSIIYCVGCGFVKNVNRTPKIRWVNEQWLLDRGWERQKKKYNKKPEGMEFGKNNAKKRR